MFLRIYITAFCVLVFLGQVAMADTVITFDQEDYEVPKDIPFQVQVMLDMDAGVPGYQMPNAGLFSTGVLMSYDGSAFQISDPDGMEIPSDLATDGIGGPPDKLFGDGQVGFAGALSLDAVAGYQDPLLVTFTITPVTVGDFTFSLERFYPTKANTMDFDGNVLDGQITFGSAAVNVVPEPASMSLVAMGALALLLIWRIRSK